MIPQQPSMVHAPYASAPRQPAFEQQAVLSNYAPKSPITLEPTFDMASGRYVLSAPYQAPAPPAPAAVGPYTHQFASYAPQVQASQPKMQPSYGSYSLLPAEQAQYSERYEAEPPWKHPPGMATQMPQFNAYNPSQMTYQNLGGGLGAQRLRQ